MTVNDPLNRRHFLKTLGYSTAGLALLSSPFISGAWAASPQRLFQVPPLASGVRDGKNISFSLNIQQGQTEFLNGRMTPTLGYNGSYLGPMLRVRRGDFVSIKTTNDLDVTSTVHWHGMILPANMDGGPHQMIKPKASLVSKFEIIQPAATLFYHSHTYHKTAEQVYFGLAGPLIIDDDETDALDIPREYGVDDLPVIIQDRDFNDDGSFRYITRMPDLMLGKHGSTVMVNGVISPLLKAQKTLLRLRVTNASNARFYALAFNDSRPFQVIASDGGMLEKPVTVKQLNMGPAERFEILVDVSDRKQVILQGLKGAGNVNHGPMRMMGLDGQMDILFIDATDAKPSEHKTPSRLVHLADWSNVNIAENRHLDLNMSMGNMMGGGQSGGGFTINGATMDMNRVDFRLKKNTYEIWTFTNNSPMLHPMHVHNTQFKVLFRNGRLPSPLESGFKDTVVVGSGETVKILMPTGPYADPNGYYMHHCHILEHEDAGMMGQFVVVD